MAKQVGISTSDFEGNAYLEEYSSFAVVVAGEYNAGKSTLINALLGTKLLETGSLPTTDGITIITHDDALEQHLHSPEGANISSAVHHRVQSLPLLQDLTIVDTPGTNAVLTNHTATTLRLLPSADLILFVTSADRPFPESERSFLESIATMYRKNIVVVINKMDILEESGGVYGSTEKERVTDYVIQHASSILNASPMVFAVSARDALASKIIGQRHNPSAVWKRSNFETLENCLRDSFTTQHKIKCKLSSPIGVAEGLITECRNRLRTERYDLEADVATLNLLHTQFTAWRKEVDRTMNETAEDIRHRVEMESNRGFILLRRLGWAEFYTLCITTNTPDNGLELPWSKTQPSFNRNTSVQEEILVLAQNMADSVALQSRAQGQTLIEFLGTRPSMTRNRSTSLVGSITAASRFEETRQLLTHNLSQVVQHHFYLDEGMVQKQFLSRLRNLAWITASLSVCAIGSLVAGVTQIIGTVPGLGSTFTLVTVNIILVTIGRHQLAQQYANTWLVCGQRLDEELQKVNSKEADRLGRHIRDGVAPYVEFVEAEESRLDRLYDQCDHLLQTAQRLRKRINDS